MVLVLQGEGVRIDLTGGLFVSAKNITSVAFRTIPDVPIRRFGPGPARGQDVDPGGELGVVHQEVAEYVHRDHGAEWGAGETEREGGCGRLQAQEGEAGKEEAAPGHHEQKWGASVSTCGILRRQTPWYPGCMATVQIKGSPRRVKSRFNSLEEWDEWVNANCAPRRADDGCVLMGQTGPGPRKRATRDELIAFVNEHRARHGWPPYDPSNPSA